MARDTTKNPGGDDVVFTPPTPNPPTTTGGGTGGPETDPIASSALTQHLNDTNAAHAASAVSINPSGLVVVTGTDVQAAIAQLDTWAKARPVSESGTLANRPNLAASPRPDQSTYFATDDNLGTTYRVVGGAWVKQSGAVGDSGGRELAYADMAASMASANAVDANFHDVPGLQIGFVGGTRPIKVRALILAAVGLGTAAAGGIRRVTLGMAQVDAQGVVTVHESGGWTGLVNTGNNFQSRILSEWRFQPVPGTAYTFKAQIQVNVVGLNIGVFGQDLGAESFIEAVER